MNTTRAQGFTCRGCDNFSVRLERINRIGSSKVEICRHKRSILRSEKPPLDWLRGKNCTKRKETKTVREKKEKKETKKIKRMNYQWKKEKSRLYCIESTWRCEHCDQGWTATRMHLVVRCLVVHNCNHVVRACDPSIFFYIFLRTRARLKQAFLVGSCRTVCSTVLYDFSWRTFVFFFFFFFVSSLDEAIWYDLSRQASKPFLFFTILTNRCIVIYENVSTAVSVPRYTYSRREPCANVNSLLRLGWNSASSLVTVIINGACST